MRFKKIFLISLFFLKKFNYRSLNDIILLNILKINKWNNERTQFFLRNVFWDIYKLNKFKIF